MSPLVPQSFLILKDIIIIQYPSYIDPLHLSRSVVAAAAAAAAAVAVAIAVVVVAAVAAAIAAAAAAAVAVTVAVAVAVAIAVAVVAAVAVAVAVAVAAAAAAAAAVVFVIGIIIIKPDTVSLVDTSCMARVDHQAAPVGGVAGAGGDRRRAVDRARGQRAADDREGDVERQVARRLTAGGEYDH